MFFDVSCSGNDCGPVGTMAIGNWLGHQRFHDKNSQVEVVYLRQLLMETCNLDTPHIFMGLAKSSYKNTVQVLDVSGSKINRTAFVELVSFINNSCSLFDLRLARCSLNSKKVVGILYALAKNEKLNDVHLDISCNFIAANSTPQLGALLSSAKNITSISLANNMFDRGLEQIVWAVVDCKGIRKLNISGNRYNPKNSTRLFQALTELLERSMLEELDISGMDLGPGLGNVLTLLSNNKKVFSIFGSFFTISISMQLKILDVSRNNMGDDGALELSGALVSNNTLTSLKWDLNGVTMDGFMAFRYPFYTI
jgi:Ran GTPase-activating protein (RanGAP) involved in mRNA processing and transport